MEEYLPHLLTFSEKSNSVKQSPYCGMVFVVVGFDSDSDSGECHRWAPYQPLTPPVTFPQLENQKKKFQL